MRLVLWLFREALSLDHNDISHLPQGNLSLLVKEANAATSMSSHHLERRKYIWLPAKSR